MVSLHLSWMSGPFLVNGSEGLNYSQRLRQYYLVAYFLPPNLQYHFLVIFFVTKISTLVCTYAVEACSTIKWLGSCFIDALPVAAYRIDSLLSLIQKLSQN